VDNLARKIANAEEVAESVYLVYALRATKAVARSAPSTPIATRDRTVSSA